MLTFAGPRGAIDELGVWTPAAPDAPALGIALPREFALADDDRAARGLTWRQDLAAGDDFAGAMTLSQGRLAAAAAALPQAQTRAAVFAASGGQIAFVVGAEAPPAPERDLAAWARLAPLDPAGLARLPDVAAATEQVAAFFAKVRDALRSYATVVTRLDDAAIARTEVTWAGDFRAAWAPGLTPTTAARHNAAVSLALRTRDLWLRLAATVLGGAFQLAALFAANPLLALPAAYRFARQVIEQAQIVAAVG